MILNSHDPSREGSSKIWKSFVFLTVQSPLSLQPSALLAAFRSTWSWMLTMIWAAALQDISCGDASTLASDDDLFPAFLAVHELLSA